LSTYVLLIDDHEDSRELAASWLQMAGLSVAAYASAEEALTAIEVTLPTVVVTDVVLPGMSGIELARRLRASERTRHVGLVALTGRSDVDRGVFDALLIKPYDPTKLTLVVSELAGRITAGRGGASPSIASTLPAAGVGNAASPSVSSTLPAAGLVRGGAPSVSSTLPAASRSSVRSSGGEPSMVPSGPLVELHRLLAEQLPLMLWRSGTDGQREWFNEAWLSFTGRRPEQEVGEGWIDGVHADDHVGCVDAILARVERREPFEIEYRLRRRDGAYRWVCDRGAPCRGAGGVYAGYVGGCVDVDERRRSDEARASFLSTMAHDLRGPLTPLRAFAYQLRRSLARGETPAEDQVRRFEGQLDRMVALIDHVGEAGRIAAGKAIALEQEPFDLAAVVREQVESERERLGRRKDPRPAYDLRVRGAERPLVVRGDRAKLGKALKHLIDNALKFSPRGGPVEVSLEAPGSSWRLEVRDEGVGVPRGELAGLGRPYARASNASPVSYPGAGLGLAMAREIAAAHGGRLDIEPGGDKGTRVALIVPIASGGLGPVTKPPAEARSARSAAGELLDGGGEQGRLEGFDDPALGAERASARDEVGLPLGGEHDDRQVRVPSALLDRGEHLEAAHLGHVHVAEHHGEARRRLELAQRVFAVDGFDDAEAGGAKGGADLLPYRRRVVDDQYVRGNHRW
jgi:PAS domain S-box-containing protein